MEDKKSQDEAEICQNYITPSVESAGRDKPSHTRIPRFLHHIWVGSEAPSPLLEECRGSVVSLHTDWDVHYWHERNLRHTLRAYLPDYRDALEFKGNHRFADVARYLLLYEFGGWYVDHDVWGVRSFEGLCNESMVFGAHKFGNMRRQLTTNAVLGAVKSDERLLAAATYTIDQFSHSRHYNMGGLAFVARTNNVRPKSYRYFCPHYYKEPAQRYRVFDETYAIHLWHRHLSYDTECLRKATRSQETGRA